MFRMREVPRLGNNFVTCKVCMVYLSYIGFVVALVCSVNSRLKAVTETEDGSVAKIDISKSPVFG